MLGYPNTMTQDTSVDCSKKGLEGSRMKTSQIAAKLSSVALTISLVATAPVFTQAMVTNIAIEADTFIVARSPANNVGGGTHVAVGRDGSAGDGRRRGMSEG